MELLAKDATLITALPAVSDKITAHRAVTCILYDDLYLTEQPYGLVCGVVTGLPARDSSNAALT